MSRLSISKNEWKIGCAAFMSKKRTFGSTRFMLASNGSHPGLPKSPYCLKSSTITNPPFSIRAQRRGFPVAQLPPADLDDVRDGILEELGIVERDRVDRFLRIEEAHLVHDAHQVLFGNRVAVRP